MESGISDCHLVQRAQNRSEKALKKLYKRYETFLTCRAKDFYLTGSDEDDVLQECYIGFHKAICDYNKEKDVSFKCFADLCIKRHISTAIASAGRNKHKPLFDYAPISQIPIVSTFSNEANPLKNLMIKEFLASIALCLDSLSNIEKQVFRLCNQGYSYSDIAQKTLTTEKAVDNALQRVRKKIKRSAYCNIR